MWDDTRFGLEHRNDLLKFAVIGGPDWVDWGARIAGLLMDTEVETFGPEEQRHGFRKSLQNRFFSDHT